MLSKDTVRVVFPDVIEVIIGLSGFVYGIAVKALDGLEFPAAFWVINLTVYVFPFVRELIV